MGTFRSETTDNNESWSLVLKLSTLSSGNQAPMSFLALVSGWVDKSAQSPLWWSYKKIREPDLKKEWLESHLIHGRVPTFRNIDACKTQSHLNASGHACAMFKCKRTHPWTPFYFVFFGPHFKRRFALYLRKFCLENMYVKMWFNW